METGAGAHANVLRRILGHLAGIAAAAHCDLDNPGLPRADGRAQPNNGSQGGAIGFSPVLPIANAVLALSFAAVAIEHYAEELVLGWLTGSLLASLFPVSLRRRWRLRDRRNRSLNVRIHELCTILLGLVWAAFPALFFDAASSEIRLLAVALIFGISGIGSLGLARVPSSAILFCALIAGSLTLASIKIGGETGLALGAFAILYSLAVAGMILHAHQWIVHRAAAGAEIRKQNEIIALLLDDFDKGARNWLWETDSGGRLTYVSQQLCRVVEKPVEQLIGRDLATAVAAASGDAGWDLLRERMEGRQAVEDVCLSLPCRGAVTWWRIAARPRFGDDGELAGYRGAARDITGDRQAESELIAAKEAAERASASKSQFLAVMSHELRTPLNAIVGFAELLGSRQAECLSEEARADHLRTIVDSGRHLLALINDILDATRIEKGTMRLVEQEADAGELTEVAVKMCRDAAEKADVTIVARIVDGVELAGDITRIKQVLINLITNAVKFSAPGGVVNVVFEATAGGGLSIAVRDGGIGIRKDDLQRIFEPFVQADSGTSRRFGGIGLGLAIARKIAMLHGGNVTLESELGVGTTARLVLPAARIAWPAAQPAVDAA